MAGKVVINEDECIGCEACVETCPEVFSFDDDDGKAYVNEGVDGTEECIEEAIASCPSECITQE